MFTDWLGIGLLLLLSFLQEIKTKTTSIKKLNFDQLTFITFIIIE